MEAWSSPVGAYRFHPDFPCRGVPTDNGPYVSQVCRHSPRAYMLRFLCRLWVTFIFWPGKTCLCWVHLPSRQCSSTLFFITHTHIVAFFYPNAVSKPKQRYLLLQGCVLRRWRSTFRWAWRCWRRDNIRTPSRISTRQSTPTQQITCRTTSAPLSSSH